MPFYNIQAYFLLVWIIKEGAKWRKIFVQDSIRNRLRATLQILRQRMNSLLIQLFFTVIHSYTNHQIQRYTSPWKAYYWQIWLKPPIWKQSGLVNQSVFALLWDYWRATETTGGPTLNIKQVSRSTLHQPLLHQVFSVYTHSFVSQILKCRNKGSTVLLQELDQKHAQMSALTALLLLLKMEKYSLFSTKLKFFI